MISFLELIVSPRIELNCQGLTKDLVIKSDILDASLKQSVARSDDMKRSETVETCRNHGQVQLSICSLAC